MSEYDETVQRYLDEWGVKFTIRLLGDACPPFCEDKGKPGIGEFPRKTHIHGQHWGYMFYRQGKDNLSSDYWDSYKNSTRRYVANNWHAADRNLKAEVLGYYGSVNGRYRNLTNAQWHTVDSGIMPSKVLGWRKLQPSTYDVLSCLTKYEPGQFDDWCSDLGYDTDSRKAEQIYYAVCEEWAQVRQFFSEAELEVLREVAV